MSVTIQDVVRSLSPDEADLRVAAAALGPAALSHLEALVMGPDPMLASKAAYAASLIRDANALRVLQVAAARPDRMVRMAAATAARSLPPDEAGQVLGPLLADPDPECRRIALEAVSPQVVPHVRSALEALARTDPYPTIQRSSAEILARSPNP
jgi:hypothetical protein